MKMESKNNLKIVLIVVGFFSISYVLFSMKGWDAALYFTIIGIPLFFIAFGYQYVKNLRGGRTDPALVLKTQDTEKIAYEFKSINSTIQNLKDNYGLELDQIEDDIKTIANKDLSLIGIDITEADGNYITSLNEKSIENTDMDSIENVARIIEGLNNQLKNIILDHADTVSQNYISMKDDLKNAGYNIGSQDSDIQNFINNRVKTDDINDNIRYIDNLASIIRNIINSCLNEVENFKQKVSELDKDVSGVESNVVFIKENIESRNYRDIEKGVSSLIQIIQELETSAGGDFESNKNIVISAIETIIGAVDDKIDDENTNQLLKLESDVKSLESASKMGELQQIEPQIIPIAIKIVESISKTITDNELKIEKEDFPEDFYPSRESFEKECDELVNDSNLEYFSSNFSKLLNTMLPIMQNSNIKSRVIIIYKKIESQITKDLKTKGIVKATDIKVKNPDEFLKLYSQIHPEVLYDSINNTLSTELSTSSYNISVAVFDKNNKPLAGANVILKLDKEIIKKVKTKKDGNAILKDISGGSYKLGVKLDGYKTSVKKIELGEDQTLEIKMQEKPFGDLLCKEKKEALQKSLPKFNDIIQNEIDKNKYLMSTFEFKMKPEFIPCLLFLWSENNGNIKFIKTKNDYMLYDDDEVAKEIEYFIEDIEAGKSEKISDLTDGGLLSVPLPVDEIFTIIDTIKSESDFYKDLEYDNKRIWKSESALKE